MRERKLKAFRHCDICGEDIPREKFGRHQYWLGGVRTALCRGMKASVRKVYETLSLKRLKRGRTQARLLGYTEPREVEAYLRGLGYGDDVLPKKLKKAKQGK
jgi:hypothetical protein